MLNLKQSKEGIKSQRSTAQDRGPKHVQEEVITKQEVRAIVEAQPSYDEEDNSIEKDVAAAIGNWMYVGNMIQYI